MWMEPHAAVYTMAVLCEGEWARCVTAHHGGRDWVTAQWPPPICHLWYYNPCPYHYLSPTCIGFILLSWFAGMLLTDSFFPSACSVLTVNRFILTPVQPVMPCPSITFPLPLPWFSSPRWWQEWCGTSCCPFRADRDPRQSLCHIVHLYCGCRMLGLATMLPVPS